MCKSCLGSFIFCLALAGCATTPELAHIHSDVDSVEKPWTNLAPKNDPEDFQFVIVTDRTGGHRPGVFPKAMEKVNLLQPEIVVSVGDLIEGYTTDAAIIEREWDEFDGFLKPLEMPFFYLPGNHDYTNEVMAEIWKERLGPSYYSFVYRDVLFLCLNTMEAGHPSLGQEQVEWAKETLRKHPDPRWTIVLLHHPLWVSGDDGGWAEISEALRGREHTVFAGHYHQYTRYERNDAAHIVLATTGGASGLRGPVYGEFDHVVWVTMTDDGPVLANLMIDGIHDEHIRNEAGGNFAASFADRGALRLDPVYVSGDEVVGELNTRLRITNDADATLVLKGTVEALDSTVEVPPEFSKTIRPNSVEFVELSLVIRHPQPVGELLPARIKWTATLDDTDASPNTVGGSLYLAGDKLWPVSRSEKSKRMDGDLSDWTSLGMHGSPLTPEGGQRNWTGPEDGGIQFDVRYDDDFVYFAAIVTDDEVNAVSTKTPLEQDGVHLYFDARPDPDRSAGRGEGIMIDFLLVSVSPGEGGLSSVYLRDLLPPDVVIASTFTPTGYTVEIAIPTAYLNEHQGRDWDAFRLDVRMNDYDGEETAGEQSILGWRPGWRTPFTFPGSGTFVKQ